MSLALVVLLPLLGAPLPWALWRLARVDPAASAGTLAFAALGLLLAQSGPVFEGTTLVQSWQWMPAIGLAASYRLDGYSLLFALLVLGIGLLVLLYARHYLAAEDSKPRFFGLLLLFMGSMLGVVLAENLLLLVVYWELTSLSSFLLIGFWRGAINARRGARLALLVTGAGGLALLAGVLLLGHVADSYELSEVLAAGDRIRAHPLYGAILALVLLGAFTKSAQIPFHYWLPHAMAAPTPVSAYLHSATMVKAGVFLLGRLFPALAGTETWFFVVSGAGLATQLFAAYLALFRHDLKGLLAYSTISHLGLITLLFGIGTPFGATAAVFHVINHAIFKASLFMAAGIIEHETGTRDMRRLSGLARQLPWTAALATVAAASMAGVPLLNGFLSKEMFFAETLHVRWLGDWYWLLPVAATLASTFTVAYSLRFVHDVFFDEESRDLTRIPHEPPLGMKIPVAVLVALCLAVGLAPGLTIEGLLRLAAAAALQGVPPGFSVKLWHGFNLPLLMSAIALTAGSAIYFLRRYQLGLHRHEASRVDGRVLSERFVGALVRGSRTLLALVANGSLQRYIWLLLVLALVLGAWGARGLVVAGPLERLPADPATALFALALVLAALACTRLHAQRTLAIVLVGIVGLVVSLAFARLSAPDLALTQLLVEIATVILLMLAMFFLPRDTPRDRSRGRRARDLVLAGAIGLGTGLLAYAMLTRPFDSLSWYYLDHAKPEGGGYNVVNVILVDFRGFDTLGEITVLGIAAVGVQALLSGLRLLGPATDGLGRPWWPRPYSTLLQSVARPLLPLALLVSVYLFLRGHNAPGGGFIAGLVTGTALILQFIAHGSRWASERLRTDLVGLIAAGVLIAVACGVGSWWFGRPFLTSTFGHLHWPVVGHFELASALVFDFGVYLAVVGTLLVILERLGQLSEGPPAAEVAACAPEGGGDR